MKVTIEFDTDNPQHQDIIRSMLPPAPPAEYTAGKTAMLPPGVMTGFTTVPPPPAPQIAPELPPPPPPAAPQRPAPDVRTFSDAPPAAPALPPTPPVQQQLPTVPDIGPPATGQAAIPTPTTDLRQQMHQMYIQAFAVDPTTAQDISSAIRTKFKENDDVNWTEAQVKEAITTLQAAITF